MKILQGLVIGSVILCVATCLTTQCQALDPNEEFIWNYSSGDAGLGSWVEFKTGADDSTIEVLAVDPAASYPLPTEVYDWITWYSSGDYYYAVNFPSDFVFITHVGGGVSMAGETPYSDWLEGSSVLGIELQVDGGPYLHSYGILSGPPAAVTRCGRG